MCITHVCAVLDAAEIFLEKYYICKLRIVMRIMSKLQFTTNSVIKLENPIAAAVVCVRKSVQRIISRNRDHYNIIRSSISRGAIMQTSFRIG